MEIKRQFVTKVADPERIFYLTCWAGQNSFEEEVWFVNNSDETLEYVRPASGGFATSGNDVIPMTQSPDSIEYRDVKPGEGVMIDVYDIMFDGDFLISWGVDLKSPSLGERSFGSFTAKGVAPNVTLHWRSLPEETRSPNDLEKLIDPYEVAEAYRKSSGRSLAVNAHFNKGNLLYSINTGFLNVCGLQLSKESLRGGHVKNYRFLNQEGIEIFRTLDLDRAMMFILGLKAA